MSFLMYYTVTGFIMAVVCAVNYKKICEQTNIMSDAAKYVGIEIFVLLNFLAGFLNAPICIPIMIKSFFLRRKLKRLTKENEHLTESNERMREAIRKREEFNEKVKKENEI